MIVKLAGQAGALVRATRSAMARMMLSGVKGVAGAAFVVYGVAELTGRPGAAALAAGGFLLLADWKDSRSAGNK